MTMANQEKPTINISGTIGGSASGQTAIGQDITQIHTEAAPVSEAELAELRQAFDSLKKQVAEQAPPDKQAQAVQHLDELHEAVTAPKPELSTMEFVRNWFVKNIPTMAGAVTSIVINPIVGRLVQAGGDVLAADFKRRFGGVS
jgi:hypothetical protein